MRNQEEKEIGRQQNTPKWSGEPTYCVNINIQCEELDPPVNGFFHHCENYGGLPCVVGCHPGYRLIGSQSFFCNEQGTWSEDLPTCQQI